MSKEMYEVLEVKGKPGLTVGSNVLKPGQRFSRGDWPYPEKNLLAALKGNRCKKVFVDSKAAEKSGDKNKKQLKLEGMELNYSKMEKDSPAAEKLLSKINDLKEEMKS
ncbi:hypothetical protein KAR91_68420 [Candidatus Pacearchaeota archaeon]|nr:hypothetical protein [Candidatus Pacearchaeota archaeon]